MPTPEERKAREEAQAAVEREEQEKIEALLNIESGMTDWEAKFADSVGRQFQRDKFLSPKQWAIVDRILEKQDD